MQCKRIRYRVGFLFESHGCKSVAIYFCFSDVLIKRYANNDLLGTRQEGEGDASWLSLHAGDTLHTMAKLMNGEARSMEIKVIEKDLMMNLHKWSW